MMLRKYPPDPDFKRRWFNRRWYLIFNLPLTLLLTPLMATYQFVWHGGKYLSILNAREWMEGSFIAFIFVSAAYVFVGDGWVYYPTRQKLREPK
jgi:hypothetical protein